ncbi:MAG: signal peptidase II [Verrucomicrobiota bacterium]|nr:signal peptidase II [Verrucomicrobiota bacterium]
MEEKDAQGTAKPVPFFQEKRVLIIAATVLAADQLTKQLVVHTIDTTEQIIIIEGFLKLVNWHNTGAAWSQFEGKSLQLAIISFFALGGLIHFRHHFEIHTKTGKAAMGMLIGGIIGNLIDRVAYQHVVDFIRFYLYQREGGEIGYPAFNIADMGICVGVGLMFVQAWGEQAAKDQKEEE